MKVLNNIKQFCLNNRNKLLIGFAAFMAISCLANLIIYLVEMLPRVLDPTKVFLLDDINYVIIFLVTYFFGFLSSTVGLIVYIKTNKLSIIRRALMLGLISICSFFAADTTKAIVMFQDYIDTIYFVFCILAYIGVFFGSISLIIPEKINKFIKLVVFSLAFLFLIIISSMAIHFNHTNLVMSFRTSEYIKHLFITIGSILYLITGILGILFSWLLVIEENKNSNNKKKTLLLDDTQNVGVYCSNEKIDE